MIEVKIETDEDELLYNFPENWDEVTVKQFCDVFKNNYDNHSSFYGSVLLMSALTGVDKEIIEMMDVDDFKMLLEKLKFMQQDVIKSEDDKLFINDEEYFLYNDFSKYTTGEIITIEILLEQAENNVIRIMPELLCVFLRKKNAKGNIEKFKTSFMNRKYDFEKLPISKIYHIFSFFFLGKNTSINSIKDSMPNQEK
jgi:hypothetical protein